MTKKRIWMVALVALMLAAAACTCAPLSDITGELESIVDDAVAQVTAESVVIQPTAANEGGNISTGETLNEGLGAPVYDGGDGYETTYVGAMVIGDTVSDSIPTLFEAHNWQFYGVLGDTVAIRANAVGDSDPRIVLIGPSGNILSADDDSGDDRNAYLIFTMNEDGIYTVRVDMWTEGQFTLSIETEAADMGAGAVDTVPGGAALDIPVYDGGDGYETTFVGSLEVGAAVLDSIPTLFEAHNWQFRGTAGQMLTIRVNAIGDADPRIMLIDPAGTVIGEDDDGGGDYNSLLTVTLPLDGIYTIRVDMWTEGQFTVSVQ